MNLDGTWQYQGYTLLNSNQPTINKPTIKGYVEQMQYQSGTTLTIVPDNGTVICFTTSGNTTVTLPAPVDGVTHTLIISYTGAHTVTFIGGDVRWAGGTAPATTSIANKMDKYVFTGVAGYTLGKDGGRNV